MAKVSEVAHELTEILLRFSNEQRASDWGGERGRLVQDGRYAKEAAMMAKAVGALESNFLGQRTEPEPQKDAKKDQTSIFWDFLQQFGIQLRVGSTHIMVRELGWFMMVDATLSSKLWTDCFVTDED